MIAVLILSKDRLFFFFFSQRISMNCDLGKSIISRAHRLSEQNTCSSVLQAFLMWKGSCEADGNHTFRGLVALTPSLQMLTAELA